MSFLRKMFSGKVSTDDPRRFLVESMLGAMEADGDVTDEEMATFEGSLANHPLFEGLSSDELGRLTEIAADAIRVAGGGKERLPAIAAGLPSRSQRLAAYALAAESASPIASSRSPRSISSTACRPRSRSTNLRPRKSSRPRASTRACSRSRRSPTKVRHLMPAFVQCMALMAAADGEIHHEERLGMRAVLRNIPDMSVLTGAELDEAIDVALERIAGKDNKAELAAVAKEIPQPSDRYWVTVYVMIIALPTAMNDWREIEFLAAMKKTFGLNDNQMDLAMKTASQFPAVDLGGLAPD